MLRRVSLGLIETKAAFPSNATHAT